jgi:3-phosphoshikimate 1-carboxyvinyltransferase
MRALGVRIEEQGGELVVQGKGLHGLGGGGERGPLVIDCANSGTTARLLMGLLCGAGVHARLIGDESLSRRPMERVAGPLRAAGAAVACAGGTLPCEIGGRAPRPFTFTLPVASAQVKSALLLAALFVRGTCTVVEPVRSRDHTERMLQAMGAALRRSGDRLILSGGRELEPLALRVPGDLSSSSFFMAAALVCPGSRLTLKNVMLNPTRTAVIDVLRRMGARLEVRPERGDPEPCGAILASHSRLRGVRVGGREIPLLIDEIPVIAACALFAAGDTEVRDAGELRVKESDRIAAVVRMARAFGGSIRELEDGFVVRGGSPLRPARVDSFMDHRIAMAAAVIACAVEGSSRISRAQAASVSFPEFYRLLDQVSG